MNIIEAKEKAFQIEEVKNCKDDFYIERLKSAKTVVELNSVVVMILVYQGMNSL